MIQLSPYTMLPAARLAALIALVKGAPAEGALVQCGVWNGGSAAALANAMRPRRDVWLFDSFEGMPAPGAKDGARAHARYAVAGANWCRGNEDAVRDAFALIRWPERRTHIVPGWLRDTLPAAEIGPIAVLHIDVDFYDATAFVLERLAGSVVPGGFIIVDDYGHWPGARRACDEFFGGGGHDLLAGDPTRYWVTGESA